MLFMIMNLKISSNLNRISKYNKIKKFTIGNKNQVYN